MFDTEYLRYDEINIMVNIGAYTSDCLHSGRDIGMYQNILDISAIKEVYITGRTT
jgi:hypothetical protein